MLFYLCQDISSCFANLPRYEYPISQENDNCQQKQIFTYPVEVPAIILPKMTILNNEVVSIIFNIDFFFAAYSHHI